MIDHNQVENIMWQVIQISYWLYPLHLFDQSSGPPAEQLD